MIETLKKALEEIIDAYVLTIGHKPSEQDLKELFRIGLKIVRQNRELVRTGPEEQSAGIHNTLIRRIVTMDEARKVAHEMVHSSRKYKIPSCEMRVTRDGSQISLREEQVLSDGTKIMGRFYTYDKDEEAEESIANILWESAGNPDDESMLVVLKNVHNTE